MKRPLRDRKIEITRVAGRKQLKRDAEAALENWRKTDPVAYRKFMEEADHVNKVSRDANNREVPKLPKVLDSEVPSDGTSPDPEDRNPDDDERTNPEDDISITNKRPDWVKATASEDATISWIDGEGDRPGLTMTPWENYSIMSPEKDILREALGGIDAKWFVWYFETHARLLGGPRPKTKATAAQRDRYRKLTVKLRKFLRSKQVRAKSATSTLYIGDIAA